MNKELIKVLKNGGIAVIPTDTIFGVVGQARNKEAVQRIYSVKGRTPTKPLIILISDITDLGTFGIKLSEYQLSFLKKYWPGAVSVILKTAKQGIDYLTRGTGTLAFRLPDEESLRNIIREVGPLVAPSANPEGLEPSINHKMAQAYFGDSVDIYTRGKTRRDSSSTLVLLLDGSYEIIRQGAADIK